MKAAVVFAVDLSILHKQPPAFAVIHIWFHSTQTCPARSEGNAAFSSRNMTIPSREIPSDLTGFTQFVKRRCDPQYTVVSPVLDLGCSSQFGHLEVFGYVHEYEPARDLA